MIKRLKKIAKSILKPQRNLSKENTKKKMFPIDLIPISETKKNDVFIVGFPKSGNTLMQHIITHLVYGINDEGSRSMVNLIVPDIYANSHYFRFNDTCYFKSHELPKPEYKKVIYIIRDGREALLSYYHMMKNMKKPVLLEDLYSGKQKIFNTTWQEHIKQWEHNPYQAEILWIKFEDLKMDKITELKRMCQFLNINSGKEELEEVIRLTSLEHMKALEKRTDWLKMKKLVNFDEGSFVRKGETDSYIKEVPQESIKAFETLSKEILKKYYIL